MKDVSILGLGASGYAAARLVLNKGGKVYVSDTRSDAQTSTRGTELRALGAEVELGRHDVERIAHADTVVVSPGIPPDAPVLAALRQAGVHWISEPELAVRFFRGPLIAVTGTNGKTTTCAVTTHLLERSGMTVALGGNIGAGLGPAASELALREAPPDWYVLELSSFQLAYIDRLRPDVGVFTNLAADHLDRYDSVEAYRADKARLFENATAETRWVLNADDPAVLALAEGHAGERSYFSLERTDLPGAFSEGDLLSLRTPSGPVTLVERDALQLLGRHNVANALAASAAAHLAGADARSIADGLSTVSPLSHRLEPVIEIDGVLWVNDSKATNVAASLSAAKSLEARPLVVLLGGQDKGEDFHPLGDALRGRARCALTFGAAGPRIHAALEGVLPLEAVPGTFLEVMERARERARPGDIVLLSPACSSFDMFDNYEHRGARFREVALTFDRGGARS